MARTTSIAAYQRIKEGGLLSRRRMEVYDTVFQHGPMTSAEAFQIMNDGRPMRSLTQSRARFTELRELGCFQEMGSRRCGVTGHEAILWDVTSEIPKKRLPKKRSPQFKKGYELAVAKVQALLAHSLFADRELMRQVDELLLDMDDQETA